MMKERAGGETRRGKGGFPPERKNAPDLLSERTFRRGEKDYLRRDYGDGTVDLIYYDGALGAWVYEMYERFPIAGMDYDFEACLSSTVFCMRYLTAIAVCFSAPRKK